MNLTKIKEILTTKEFTAELYSEEDGSTAVSYLEYNLPSAKLLSIKEFENGKHIIKGVCSKKDYQILKEIRDITLL